MKRHSSSRCVSSVIGTGVILCASVVHAQSIPVLNHTYEFDTIPHDTQKTTAISGWVNSGNGAIGVEIPLGGGMAYHGFENLSQAAFLEEGGRMRQTLDFNVIKGQAYALKYQVGRPLGEQGHNLISRITARGLTLAQHQTHVTQLNEGQWGEAELIFTATENMPVGFPIAIEFYNPPSEFGAKVHIDSVSMNLVEGQSTPSNLTNITVLNHNYEFDLVPVETDKTDFISGWSSTGNGNIGVEYPQGGGLDYHDNSSLGQAAYLDKGGRISQALDIKVEKGETYTLNYNVGRPLGTSDHGVMARIKSEGLVLAHKHTRAEHVEPGQRLAQSLSFTATEDMPLGSTIAIEFYNPPTTAGEKVHIDNVRMLIAGTGEDYIAPLLVKFPDEVIDDVVNTDLTINIPEDFDDLHQAIGYLDNKIIQNDKLVTIQVNDCGHTYNESLEMSHPQGSQITIQGRFASCRLNFSNTGGFVVSTGLKALRSFYLYGPNNSTTTSGLRIQDGATVGQSDKVLYYLLGNSVEATEGSYARVFGLRVQQNQSSGIRTNFGAFTELDSLEVRSDAGGVSTHNAGISYIVNSFYVNNSSLNVSNQAYVYSPASININGHTNFSSTSLSNLDLVGTFPNRSDRHYFIPTFSSWINLDNYPGYGNYLPTHNSWTKYR